MFVASSALGDWFPRLKNEQSLRELGLFIYGREGSGGLMPVYMMGGEEEEAAH